jgi:hypothetical protein
MGDSVPMRNRNRHPLALLFLVLGIGVGMATGGWYFTSRTKVEVVNESGHELAELSISLPGRTCAYENVPFRARRSCNGRANGDGPVELYLRLASGVGRRVTTETYMSPALGWRGSLILRADGTIEVRGGN